MVWIKNIHRFNEDLYPKRIGCRKDVLSKETWYRYRRDFRDKQGVELYKLQRYLLRNKNTFSFNSLSKRFRERLKSSSLFYAKRYSLMNEGQLKHNSNYSKWRNYKKLTDLEVVTVTPQNDIIVKVRTFKRQFERKYLYGTPDFRFRIRKEYFKYFCEKCLGDKNNTFYTWLLSDSYHIGNFYHANYYKKGVYTHKLISIEKAFLTLNKSFDEVFKVVKGLYFYGYKHQKGYKIFRSKEKAYERNLKIKETEKVNYLVKRNLSIHNQLKKKEKNETRIESDVS